MSTQSTLSLVVKDWNPSALRYTPPRINDRGGKSINVLSTQTGRWLNITTPLLMTWGVADFTDDKGVSDGKYKISLNFPGKDESTESTNEFLKKMEDFEEQILNDAVKYSDIWFGEEMSREVANHTFFRSIKYGKDKITKKIDRSKPPTIRASVPFYGDRWDIEVYDSKKNTMFPDKEKPLITPIDLIPRKSKVACVLQCSGLWFGGKGWGVTWKLKQCMVKPQENLTLFGKCHIDLTSDDLDVLDSQPVTSSVADDDDEEQALETPVVNKTTTEVEDSDDEDVDEEDVVVAPKKKVVKKAVATVDSSEAAVEVAPEPVKKKVVKAAKKI